LDGPIGPDMTTVTLNDAAGRPTRVPWYPWLGVLSLALGAAIIVTTEFTPVGFLPDVAGDPDVSLGAAGLMILVPGLSAAVAAPLVILGAGHLDLKEVILALGVLVALSNGIAWDPGQRRAVPQSDGVRVVRERGRSFPGRAQPG
jgi:hypothetical protein